MCIESVAANGLEHSKVLLLPILLNTIEHLSYLDGEKRLLRVHGSLLILNLIIGASAPTSHVFAKVQGHPHISGSLPFPGKEGTKSSNGQGKT